MKKDLKVSIINPSVMDGLARTILDGAIELNKEREDFEFHVSSMCNNELPLEEHLLQEKDFIEFSKKADFILFIWGKRGFDYKLVKKIGLWKKTIFIDVSEVGKNRRYDFEIQYKILQKKYREKGCIDRKMLKLCMLYFRREKPYIDGIIPLPFGIESRYLKHIKNYPKKDIDFCCVFGQDEYPLMRRYAVKILEKFCKRNKFKFHIKKTKSPDEFYEILSRSKVGISVGGGGYDSYRFWEVLGNNCLLLTENIDIFQIDSHEFDYDRIWEFNNLYDFKYQLEKIGEFLRVGYDQEYLKADFEKILLRHSSKTRMLTILENYENKINREE